MLKQNPNLKLAQNVKLAPHIMNYLNILQMNSIELSTYIKEECESNPMLEIISLAEDANSSEFSSFYDGSESGYESYTAEEETLEFHLIQQLNMQPIDRKVRNTAERLIYSLDRSGFLPYDEDELLRICGFPTPAVLKKALNIVRNLSPEGIGSESLRDCLIRQNESKNSDDKKEMLNIIISSHLEDLGNSDFKKISKSMNISIEDVKSLLEDLRKLNPIPSSGFLRGSDSKTQYLRPDVFLEQKGENLNIKLEEKLEPQIRISNSYLALLKESEGEAAKYLKKNLMRARTLIQSMEQRRNTIKNIAQIIAELQKDFFILGGIPAPMNLSDIAERAKVSISTVSRTVRSKNIGTDRGIFPLSYFFSNKLFNDNDISSLEIKSMIKEIIETEDRSSPLSDNKICSKLNEEGISIARRTVAKYREELGFPSGYKRKNI